MTLLALAFQTSAPQDPFFSNDIKGLMRLGALVFSILGPMFFVVFKLVFNSTNDKVKTLSEDLTGFGMRLGKQETAQTTCSAEIGAMKQTMTRHETKVEGIAISQAKVETKVEEMARQQVELQRDVMSAVTESGRQQTAAMTELKIEIAKLTERNKFGDALSEIAEILRERHKEEARAIVRRDREGLKRD
jgi:hypothetical protein